ncbi:thioredoxin domain-containing protein 17-like isoform X2 [Physella acuta]|uniref:thioredoxin domain-containing protein 17-like isoform X2 n=1 Tax=Physella acuta TaxID=109671 RepID=UPI0027DBC367|nr:thioredoxin domain-containing protein 17-like isoform X2 [Physella acuta]
MEQENAKFRTFEVQGYAALKTVLNEIDSGHIFVLFSGSNDENGQSWCPDCVEEPVIDRNLHLLSNNAVIIRCSVGDRLYWSNPSNEFRKDPELNLRYIPTLIKIGTPKKLEEKQCLSEDLVQMMFEEDEEEPVKLIPPPSLTTFGYTPQENVQ